MLQVAEIKSGKAKADTYFEPDGLKNSIRT